MKIHIVQKGDTLWKIAKKYGVNFEELKKMNSQLSNPDMIMPGMKIKVPTSGGSVKKEAPISMGPKKEMPTAQAPLVKEQPIVQAPIKEAPVMPIKEAPIVKEAPKVTYTPKMPQPVIPDIDINNYYMLNMANMNVQQPQLPPKPTNILPEVKEVPKAVAPVQEAPPKAVAPLAESPELPIQGGFEQPMYPEYCVPVSPILPGSGLQPGLYSPQSFLPYQQPAAMPYQPVPTAVSPAAMPYQPVPTAVSPAAMPGVPNPSYLAGMEDESSSFMPQMPMMNPMSQNPTAVMGAQSPAPLGQPMPMAPAGFAPVAPMADNCVPASPVLPGSGLGPVPTPYAGAPYGYPQQPWPIRTQQMPSADQQMQMPQMPLGGGQQMPMQQMPYDVGQQMQMPQMPYGGGQMQMPQMPYGGQQMQVPQMPYGGQQMQVPQMPHGGGQMQMPQMPYGGGQMPMQQMMPYGGGQMPMQQMMPYGGGQMPMQMPYGGGQMQMPHMQTGYPMMESPEDFGMELYPTVGMAEDCGCGAPTFPTAQVNPYVGGPGVYTPTYGGQMVQPPYMNPYAFGAGSVPAPRVFDESSEYDR